MKREIKFRGLSINSKKFVYGYYYEECGNTYILEDRQKKSELNRNQFYKIDKNTLGQFTGMKDKNGVEIYEGDIVELKNKTIFDLHKRKSTAIIIYDNDNARFWIESDTIDIKYFTMQSLSDFEIVGNIFENPELFKA